jgi:hypothetical protein
MGTAREQFDKAYQDWYEHFQLPDIREPWMAQGEATLHALASLSADEAVEVMIELDREFHRDTGPPLKLGWLSVVATVLHDEHDQDRAGWRDALRERFTRASRGRLPGIR